MAAKNALHLPEVSLSDDGVLRHLHLGTPWIQGSMRVDMPFDIALEYVQRMMAWLLFVDADSVGRRRAMQLGLGAGAITKFCWKKLRMHTTAVELNPQVLSACRHWFKLPPDGPRLAVVLADAGEEIRRPDYLGAIDALAVDMYDDDAAAPVLDSVAFYRDCRALLTDEGCLTVNLFGRSVQGEQSIARIAEAFGAQALWSFRPTREGNTVVLAQRTPTRPERALLLRRAGEIERRWGLPARKWLRVLRPVA